MLPQFPILGVRIDEGCPPALRVTRWYEPLPMRETLVRRPGEREVAFVNRAQELAHVWHVTGLLGAHKHAMLVTIECLYTVPASPEAADDRWLGQQVALAIIGNANTPPEVRRDAMQLLREMQCAQ